MMRMTHTRTHASTVWYLALSDLWHEWVLTLCLVLALAAVIAPLLLLMGLKYGTIETLRDRLVQDPVNRRVLPIRTQLYRPSWFEELGERSDVAFVTPTILPAASVIHAVGPGTEGRELLDMVPTGPGDPLLLENGGVIPAAGQGVLTASAARKLGVLVGDRIEAQVVRVRRGRSERALAALTVAAILGPRAGHKPRLYVPLSFVSDVETYKEGMAVPDRGWPGGSPVPYPSFDGIIVALERRLDDVALSSLPVNTGLSSAQEISPGEFARRYGLDDVGDGWFFYQLSTHTATVHKSSYDAIKRKLRGRAAVIMPYAEGIQLALDTGPPFPVAGFSLSASHARRLGLAAMPWGKIDFKRESHDLASIALPEGLVGDNTPESVAVTLFNGKENAVMPLSVVAYGNSDIALVPIELAGMLRTGLDRPLSYSDSERTLILNRIGFRGFRVYARSIDDVQVIADHLRTQGIETMTQAAAIERVRILDRGLTRIFWLVAIVGIVGGVAALIASLYASVQRKRREIGIIRLIGISRRQVFNYPVYQALFIGGAGVMLALGAYLLLARVINLLFASDLDLGRRICVLPGSYVLTAIVGTLAVAFLASLYAARQATAIDPAEALRDE